METEVEVEVEAVSDGLIDEEDEFVEWQCLDCGRRVKYLKRDLPKREVTTVLASLCKGDLCPNCHYAERNKRTIGLAITIDGDVKTRKLEPWLDYLRHEDR